MVELQEWDTAFFGRRIGVLRAGLTDEAVLAALSRARADGYAYVQSRVDADDAAAAHALERSGFYLTDVGVIWAGAALPPLVTGETVALRTATEADLPWLSVAAATLFPLSRFYHDPFFSAAEADRLHVAWIENAVRGQVADVVFVTPGTGFVTCRKRADGSGEVGLIGVVTGDRGRGTGRTLMTAAMDWFAAQGATQVRVKTQVKNLAAMNFYRRLGFALLDAELTFGCVLAEPPAAGIL